MLLLVGGSMNSVWADKTVTYHVITLPFCDDNLTGGHDAAHTFRIEAIRKTVTCSDDAVIELPDELKSPLLADDAYTYYYTGNSGVTIADKTKIFPNNNIKYDTYTFDTSKKLAANATIADLGAATDIYVTYDWENGKSTLANTLKIDGSKTYNIEFKNGSKSWLFAMNMNTDRGNRPQAIPRDDIKDWEDLCTDGPHKLKDGVTNESKTDYNYTWLLVNNDPYNIILETAYAKDAADFGDFTYTENNIKKKSKRARFFGSYTNTDVDKSTWATNEWGYGWPQNNTGTPTDEPGWFRGTSKHGITSNGVSKGLYFSFSLLKRTAAENDYTLVASWANVDDNNLVPNTSGNYLHMGRKIMHYPGATFSTFAAADQVLFHEIRDYTLKVRTSFYTVVPDGEKAQHTLSTPIKWSDYVSSLAPHENVPQALKRKYVNFTGSFREAGLINYLSSFAEAQDNGGEIWLNYESTFPYDVLSPTGSYTDATWYTLRLNGNVETQNVAYWDTTKGNIFSTGRGSNTDLHQGENYPESQFAFMGDPFEMKLINRLASETATANRFVGSTTDVAAPSTFNDVATGYHDRWEIVADNITGSMELREFGTYDTPKYIGWDYSNTLGTGTKPMIYADAASRIRVVDISKKTYVYHIMRSNGTIAAKASIDQVYGVVLRLTTIPEIIRSPFLGLSGVTLTYYWTEADAAAKTNSKTNGSYEYNTERDIYVRYDMGSALDSEPGSYIKGTTSFNVRLNGQYIYYDNGTIKSKATMDTYSTDANSLLWKLEGSDPYAMIINNEALSAASTPKDLYVTVPNGWAEGSIGWDESPANAAQFIIKSNTTEINGVWEVMAASGDGVDASNTYYNIGRPSGNNTTVKVYSNSTYEHGYDQLRFQLTKVDAVDVTYHLIDKAGKDLLQVVARQEATSSPVFPDDYRSPLVDNDHYYYHAADQFTDPNTGTIPVMGDANAVYHLNANPTAKTSVAAGDHIYVTYDANDLIDMGHTTMYLLKFAMGDQFRQEDGSDGLLTDPNLSNPYYSKAVYPYCNGDCNLFVYGQQQYDVQQEGAASTRTRWAWYVQSSDNDPYHVKILSRQTETYNGVERNAYFSTFKPTDYDGVITNLVWPNISGVQATEYMILGRAHQYQLVTSYTIPIDKNGDGDTEDEGESNERYVVDSFEQYFKTYDTIKKKLLDGEQDLLKDCEEKEKTDGLEGSIEVPTTPASLREALKNTYGFHSYNKMAYAKRWNGYNAAGAKSKGWESREHWFQTVKMGSGYFDFISTTISPALILLDQHGWEIMRKPLPYSDQDPDKEAKKDVLRAYDSPMVKEYIFWASAKKRSGYHQYYLMDKRIGGSDFSSTSLGDLPPWGSENVVDAKGNQYDQYVTYIVKDEYAHLYTPTSPNASVLVLIQQGDKFASTDDGTSITKNDVPTPGGMSQYIIDNLETIYSDTPPAPKLGNKVLWYIKPNASIDAEMGSEDEHDWGETNPSAYLDTSYKDNIVASIIEGSSSDATVKKYGRFTFSNGFDPYNIQISSIRNTSKYFTVGMTGAEVSEGIIVGDYSGEGGSQTLTMANKNTVPVTGNGYDNSKFKMTNQTFMAVQDADGNMQLMPRFDHLVRVKDFSTLVTPTEIAADAAMQKETHTKLYRANVYNYYIIDNDGHESLRYQSGGDFVPHTPDHFKSPFAKDFEYYYGLTYDDGTSTYTEVKDGTDISSKKITDSQSLAGVGLISSNLTGNVVYVRYQYDKDADEHEILKGKWLTMQLNEKDVQYTTYNSTAGIYADASTPTKPSPIDKNAKTWQWKFLENPYGAPDPYAVKLFNRDKTNGEIPAATRYALLSHSANNGYALAKAGTGSVASYLFLQGIGSDGNVISDTNPADPALRAEAGFRSTSCTFDGTKSQVLLIDEVHNDYTYKVYTNSGVEAIEATQTDEEARSNDWIPTLPDAARSPLLNLDQFRYYEALTDTAANSGLALTNLYGLYDNIVYVRYNAYDRSNVMDYVVPNVRNATADVDNGQVAVNTNSSNYTPLDLNEEMLYNIIWYGDNMMTTPQSPESGADVDVVGEANQKLQAESHHEWKVGGNDPYALTLYNKDAAKYITAASTGNGAACTLTADNPTTFMLLNKEGYDYGVLAITGHEGSKLTMVDDHNKATKDAATITTGDPAQFIIFALATHRVYYRLVINNIGNSETIPDRSTSTGFRTFDGSTLRDLSSAGDGKWHLGRTMEWRGSSGTSTKNYCWDAGQISLGSPLTLPQEFYRPNCVYLFYVDNIQKSMDEGNTWINDEAMNILYQGVQMESIDKDKALLGKDEGLLGKDVYINIVYLFDTGLVDTNSGNQFVSSINQNRWYTVETMMNGEPWLAQYTNAWGFELKEGRGSHYTNDFLWTPVGDAYGFQLYNRYMDVNSGNDNLGEKYRAIFSRNFSNTVEGDIHTGGQQILMGNYKNDDRLVRPGESALPSYSHDDVMKNSIYELLTPADPNHAGYFRFHPVANYEGTQYYFNPYEHADDDGDGVENVLVRLSTTPADFTFGLSKDLLKPYFDRAGYVGGLTKQAYNDNPTLVAAMKDGAEVTSVQLMEAQELVYNSANVVPFTTGYYRLHSPRGISGVDPVRYVSGYTHKTELTGGENDDPIPMHFYEENSTLVRTFTDLKTGFTHSHATQGDLPILPVDRDPASIFYFEKITTDIPVSVAEGDKDRYNLTYIGTQELYVKGKKGKAYVNGAEVPSEVEIPGERPPAWMTDNKATATKLFVMDLGGGVLLIHDNVTEMGRRYLKYLSFDYSNDTEGHSTIYDMKLTNHTHTDHAKFCMQPVLQSETKGVNEMGLTLPLNKGGDGFYYSTFCAPFDVLLTDADHDMAYISQHWETDLIHLKKVGKFNTGDYAGNNRFVPAGTPVIIRSTNTSATLALPTTSPSTPISTCIFTGKYLEQLLEMGSDDVYVFGLPFNATSIGKDPDYANNGIITSVLAQTAETGVGFYINANPNREAGSAMGEWVRNNKYVNNNRIYYRSGTSGGSAKQRTSVADFIPVVFDDDDNERVADEQQPYDNCVYDLQGRCVATGQEAIDGTWKQRVTFGIYIQNGKKYMVGRK